MYGTYSLEDACQTVLRAFREDGVECSGSAIREHRDGQHAYGTYSLEDECQTVLWAFLEDGVECSGRAIRE